jgi:predicted XRE-type DNA-binding protein
MASIATEDELLEQGGLQIYLEGLKEAARMVENQERGLREMRQRLYEAVLEVNEQGIRQETLAEALGLTQKRISQIITAARRAKVNGS